MPSAVGASIYPSTTLSYTFTNNNGTLLIVGVVVGGVSTLISSIAVTYNGVSMNAIGTMQTGHSGASAAQLFYLLNPTTGSNTVVVTAAVTNALTISLISGAISFSGNDTTSPISQSDGTFSDVPETMASIALGSTVSDNIIVNIMGCGSSIDANTDITTSDTTSWKKSVNELSGAGNGASGRTPGSGGNLTMSWSIINDIWIMAVAEIAADSGVVQLGTGSTLTAAGGVGG